MAQETKRKKTTSIQNPEVYNPEIYEQQPPENHAFSKITEFNSSAFKLTTSPVIKRVGLATHPDENPQDFFQFEHTHIFRTRDSEGRELKTSASIAGHFHIVEYEPHPEGDHKPPIVKSISAPMVMGTQKIRGKRVQTPIPMNDYDFHTHKIAYIRTDKVQARKHNVVAAMVEAQEAQKGAPPAGAAEM